MTEFVVWTLVGVAVARAVIHYRRRTKSKPCVPIKCEDWVETEVYFTYRPGSCLNYKPPEPDTETPA